MKIEIKIVEEKEKRKEIKKISEKILKGKIQANKKTIILTPKLFGKIFSPKRLELLLTLRKETSGSVTDLANKIKRKFEVVYRDLKLFEQFGFVKLTKENKRVIPELIDEIKLPIIAKT